MSLPNGTWFFKRWDRATPRVLQSVCVEFGRAVASTPFGGSQTVHIYEEQGFGRELYDRPENWRREYGHAELLEWSAATGHLRFRLLHGLGTNPEYFAGRVVEGVFVGRSTAGAPADWSPSGYSRYSRHVTGWHVDMMDAGSTLPRVFDMRIETLAPVRVANPPRTRSASSDPNVAMATLRLDLDARGTVVGRMKVYGWQRDAPIDGGHIVSASEGDRRFEEIEYDLSSLSPGTSPSLVWDGRNLAFVRRGNGWHEVYTARLQISQISASACILLNLGYTPLSFLAGRTLSGQYKRYDTPGDQPGSGNVLWAGNWWANRAEVLGYGLKPKDASAQTTWQTRTRAALQHLLMGGNANAPANPAPSGTAVFLGPWGLSPATPENYHMARDDEAVSAVNPGQYFAAEFNLIHQIPDPYAPGQTMERITHGYLAVPTTPPPAGGYPVCVALNGHGGSAYAMLRPNHWRRGETDPTNNPDGTQDFVPFPGTHPPAPDPNRPERPGPYACTPPTGVVLSTYPASDQYPYGDAFARAGYVVLAVDVCHRTDHPLDRHPGSPDNMPLTWPCYVNPNEGLENYYTYLTNTNAGDDRLNGNILRPSIKSAQPATDWTTDWVEDGMRVWDAAQALTILLAGRFGPVPSRTDADVLVGLRVDPAAVVAAGLSMGGEITTLFAALDQRPKVVVTAGYSPETGLHAYCQTGAGGHQCQQWIYADNREYANTSDLHALIAPRTLVVDTGAMDHIYSDPFDGSTSPGTPGSDGVAFPRFAHEKEVLRRSRVAYSPLYSNRVIHYVWSNMTAEEAFGGHFMRFGASTNSTERDFGTTVVTGPDPTRPYPLYRWQADATVRRVLGWPTLLTGIHAVLYPAPSAVPQVYL